MLRRVAGFFLLLAFASGIYWLLIPKQILLLENIELKTYLKRTLPFPVVFTSRSNLTAFDAVPPEAPGLIFPGEGMFQATGRLRMLTPAGKVLELTWNRKLPDGGTLVDVLSPSISPDGTRILFAGRKALPDHGRFRIYEINLSDFSLRPLTGHDADPGCVRLPPMRFDEQGILLADALRLKIDFDDIDPIELADENQTLVFSSSREPDLGRDHSRRSLQIWRWEKNTSAPLPMSANRNADRYPWQLSSNLISFSMWSRNREVVSSERNNIQYHSSTASSISEPTNNWMTMFLHPQGEQFGLLAKAPFSMVRTRALEDGRLVFMASSKETPSFTRVGICLAGWVGDSPSARPVNVHGVSSDTTAIFFLDHDQHGNPLRFATPTPYPNNQILLAMSNQESAGSIGLALAGAKDIDKDIPQIIFDDPEFVDAEPVVVLPRMIKPTGKTSKVEKTEFLGGQKEGLVLATALNYSAMAALPGQITDSGAGPIFNPPPQGLIQELRIFASERDRFDHPEIPRVQGKLHLLSTFKVKSETASGLVPSGQPTVLAGFDAQGKVAQWKSEAKDSQGRQNSTLGFAGDHYSLIGAGKKHFCVGCHPGHSGLTPGEHKHHEIWNYKFK
jgi:hypothetical protein